MKTDAQLKMDVESELDWDPAINAANVGVAVKAGIVSLTGHIDTYAEKHAIERAVQRVAGVKACAVELDVKLAPGHVRSDADIAAMANSALQWHALIPDGRVHVKVEKGWVTLSGTLDWDYQRISAEKAIRPLIGVIGISNAITLKPRITPGNISSRIRDALTRHADREARNIEVKIKDSTVTLQGQVDSWPERAAVQGAAWSAPGISSVVNEIKVGSGTDL